MPRLRGRGTRRGTAAPSRSPHPGPAAPPPHQCTCHPPAPHTRLVTWPCLTAAATHPPATPSCCLSIAGPGRAGPTPPDPRGAGGGGGGGGGGTWRCGGGRRGGSSARGWAGTRSPAGAARPTPRRPPCSCPPPGRPPAGVGGGTREEGRILRMGRERGGGGGRQGEAERKGEGNGRERGGGRERKEKGERHQGRGAGERERTGARATEKGGQAGKYHSTPTSSESLSPATIRVGPAAGSGRGRAWCWAACAGVWGRREEAHALGGAKQG